MVWPMYNATVAIITITVMHRRILRGEGRRWIADDVGLPLLAAPMVGVAGRYVIGGPSSSPLLVVKLLVPAAVVQFATVAAAPEVRGWLRRAIVARWPGVAVTRDAFWRRG